MLRVFRLRSICRCAILAAFALTTYLYLLQSPVISLLQTQRNNAVNFNWFASINKKHERVRNSADVEGGRMMNIDDTTTTTTSTVTLGSKSLLSSPQERKKHCVTKYVNASSDLTSLVQQMGSDWHWAWIRTRVEYMWTEWHESAQTLLQKHQKMRRYKAKKVLVFPQMLTSTNFASRASIDNGGPLGDMVQWADLIAMLFVMGHEVTLAYISEYVIKRLNEEPADACESFDLIYTDIDGYQMLTHPIKDRHRCKFRINDSFGTQAMFNDPEYSRRNKQFRSGYGNLGLQLKQFYTCFPHTPDNSFLGIAIPSRSHNVSVEKANYAVLYGKSPSYFKSKSLFLETVSSVVKIHSTLPQGGANVLPPGVHNHGILSQADYQKMFAKAKIVIGVELPPEGTGSLEAIARGSAIMTLAYKGEYLDIYRGKPTSRRIKSQNPYLEQFVGFPYYHVVDESNRTQIINKIKEILKLKLEPFIPYEFTTEGFLQRMSAYMEHQHFRCNVGTGKRPNQSEADLSQTDRSEGVWPPLSALSELWSAGGQSCSQTCFQKGLFCEPVYFPFINKKEAFNRHKIKSTSVDMQKDVYFPAYNHSLKTCTLQAREALFSCDMAKEELSRLCPCRDYVKYQVALCKNCL